MITRVRAARRALAACAICLRPMPSSAHSCSAEPLVHGGRCCPECDDDFVTPVRLLRVGVRRDVAIRTREFGELKLEDAT